MNKYKWLKELHKTYYAMLVRLARAELRQHAAPAQDAEGIVQQAFVRALETDIRDHDAPIKWLIKTVCTLCLRRAASVPHTESE